MKNSRLLWAALVLFLCTGPIFGQEATTQSTARVDESTLAIEDSAPAGPAGDTAIGAFSAWDFIRMILILCAVVAAIYGVVYVIKRSGGPKFQENRLIRVLSTQVLSNGRSLFLVEIGNQVFLVGSSDSAVSLVSEITDSETLDGLKLQAQGTAGGERRRFGDVMSAVFGRGTALGKSGLPGLADPTGFLRQQRQRLKTM